MKVEIQKPNILRVAYRPDPEDEGYTGCLWAHIDLDSDEWELNIQSDCGNYAYRWYPETGRSFLKFMAGISKGYLIHKLCKPDTVDIEATKENIREYLIQDEDKDIVELLEDGDEKEEIVEELYDADAKDEGMEAVEVVQEKLDALEQLNHTLSEYGSGIETAIAYKLVEDWVEDTGVEIDNAWELVDIDFSADQKRIVDIFVRYIQPALKEYLKKQSNE